MEDERTVSHIHKASDEEIRAILSLNLSTAVDINDSGDVLMVSNASGTSQVWILRAGNEPFQLTDLASAATGRFIPGTSQVVISSDRDGNERHQLYLLASDASSDEGPFPHTKLTPLIDDAEHIYHLHDVSAQAVVYSTNRANGVDFDIVQRNLHSGEERVLYDGGGSTGSVVVSPDARFVLSISMTLLPASSAVRLLDVESGQWSDLTDPLRAGAYSHPSWLPDSSGFVLSQDADTDRESLWAYSIADASFTLLASEPGADLSILLARTANPDSTVQAVLRAQRDGKVSLSLTSLRVDAAGVKRGELTPVSFPQEGFATARLSEDGSQLAVTFSAPTFPDEIFTASVADAAQAASTVELEQRTFAKNRELVTVLPAPQSVSIPARDGESIPAYFVAGDNSAVISIHGGPESASTYRYNARQAALIAAGYSVLIPNVRGSSGYGRRWLSLDDVELRLESVADLVDLHAWLVAQGTHPEKVALFGGSYGGYMVLSGMAFHPSYWASGVDIVGISSLVTFMENTSDYRRPFREREYGSLANHRHILEQASPLSRVDQLSKPLFIIHGANDPRVPLSEAEQVAAAVRANGSEAELLVYADEGHGLARRANQLDAYPRALAFLARTLAGEDR